MNGALEPPRIAAGGREVRYGLTTIRYALVRSPRRSTVSIAVDPEDGVVVTAPGVTLTWRPPLLMIANT